MAEPVERDDLIRAAELWATGATIHDVKSLIGGIRVFCEALNRTKYTGSMPLNEVREHLDRECKTLCEFMVHGNYRRARRENPPP